MRFEFEINIKNPLDKLPILICKIKGHQYKPYKNNDFYGMSVFEFYFRRDGKPWRQCSRCFDIKYKKIEDEKPRTINWSRYSPLGKTPKTATEIHLKKKK